MRKAIRMVSILVLALTLGCLLLNVGMLFWLSHSGAASVGIIGGADGLTAIFVTRSPARTAEVLLPLLGIILPVMGLLLTRKK